MSDDNRKEKLWEPFDGDALFIYFKSGGKLVWHRVLPGCFRSWKGRRKIIKHTTAHRNILDLYFIEIQIFIMMV